MRNISRTQRVKFEEACWTMRQLVTMMTTSGLFAPELIRDVQNALTAIETLQHALENDGKLYVE